MNIELLRQVQDAILLNFHRFNMSFYALGDGCGTSHCIGGWALELDGNRRGGRFEAMEALKLNSDQADILFYDSNWPEHFRLDYQNAGYVQENHEAAALIAAARIEVFIQSEGRE